MLPRHDKRTPPSRNGKTGDSVTRGKATGLMSPLSEAKLSPMHNLLDDIDRASACGLHYASLLLAMSVPDQCAALQAEDGQTSGPRYQAWYSENMLGGYLELPQGLDGPEAAPWLSAWDCYKFRCSLLHQGRSDHRQASTRRISFVEPGGPIMMHQAKLENEVILIDVPTFVADMTRSARVWMAKMSGSQPFERNRSAFIQPRRNGLPKFVEGLTVIS